MFKTLLTFLVISLSVNAQANTAASYSDYLNTAVTHIVKNYDEGEITLTLKFKKPQQAVPATAFYYPTQPSYSQVYRIETQQNWHYSQQWRYLPR